VAPHDVAILLAPRLGGDGPACSGRPASTASRGGFGPASVAGTGLPTMTASLLVPAAELAAALCVCTGYELTVPTLRSLLSAGAPAADQRLILGLN
jgi:hypothetical protein